MRKSLFVGALLGAIALTSCNTEHESRQTVPFSMLNYTVTSSGEAYSLGTSTFVLNYTSPNESKLMIEGLDFVGANTKVYDFKNLTLKGYSDRLTLESNNATVPMPSSLKATMIGYNFSNVSYQFSIDGNSVFGISAQHYFFSSTVVMNGNTGEQVKKTDEANYNRYFWRIQSKDVNTPKRTLNLYIEAAAFMDGMPSINMVFKDVNFSVHNGAIVFSKDELIPEKVNSANLDSTVPQERFKITDLNGSVPAGGEGMVSFVCNYENKDGVVVPFRVQSVLKNYTKTDSSTTTPKN